MSIGQGTVLCVREGNRRPDVTLAVSQRLYGLSIYGLNGLSNTSTLYGLQATDNIINPSVISHVVVAELI